ncbi:MAG: acid shock protein [Chitinophagaceae bacterium]|nr:acid shock protein [Chitinophagaceae bacterium]
MKKLLLLLVSASFGLISIAQEHHHHADTAATRTDSPKKSGKNKKVSSPVKKQQPAPDKFNADTAMPMDHNHGQDSVLMAHAYSRNLPMSRNGSGTGWLPDASPMYMYMQGNKTSNWMVHGNIFLRYNKQDVFGKGSRGDAKIDVPNWFMGMYNRLVGSKGLFNATAMISFDPLTVGEKGYPLLFQSGETYNGNRLVDRQHPHDLISGLSLAYTHMINKDVDITGYFGYPGEPALGPVAFMHRISALNNPDAVLGHHWQDATHIVFGVGTLGVRIKKFKLEGSIFTGREPDEDRYNFDKPRFDSYSYRLSYNPSSEWSIQVSQGFLHEPELVEPGIDVTRTSASVIRSRSLRTINWSQTLVWGMNNKNPHQSREHSILFENNLQFAKQAFYGRYEFIQKAAEELDLASSLGHRNFNIHAATIGYNHNIAPAAPIEIILGVQGTLNFPDRELKRIYGSAPVGLEIYLQLRPRRHQRP